MDDLTRRMKEQSEMMRRLFEGPAVELIRQKDVLAHVDNPAYRLAGEAAAAISTPEFLQAVEKAAQFASEVIARFQAPEFISALERAARMQHQMGEILVRQIGTMAMGIVAARQASTIDFDRIGALVAATQAHGAIIARATETLFLRHTALINSFGHDPDLIGALPAPVADLPTLDLFVHTSAVRSITPHKPMADEDEDRVAPLHPTVITETALFLEDALPRLKPAFLEQYRGMKARATSRGPDGWTQGSASMRKLLKGVLHTAAPNEIVLPWAKKNNKEFDQLGRPTRATKADWLCQYIANESYRGYLRAELDAALALINVLDKSQHVDEFPELDEGYEMNRAPIRTRHAAHPHALDDDVRALIAIAFLQVAVKDVQPQRA